MPRVDFWETATGRLESWRLRRQSAPRSKSRPILDEAAYQSWTATVTTTFGRFLRRSLP